MPSDGRLASFPDRTAHSSLTHVFLPVYKEEKSGDTPYYQKVLLEGMTNKTAADLVPLAKSWLNAPPLRVNSGGTSQGYDPVQRAYVLSADASTLSLVVDASEESPVVNLCLVVKDWPRGVNAAVALNGKGMKFGPSFRQGGVRETTDTEARVIWVELESEASIELTISQAN
jgi:hypothetical protein